MIDITKNNILENKNYYNYLKENSYWFKDLNRNSNNFKLFQEFVKDKYLLRFEDKAINVLNNIELVSNIVDALK